jgi:hypothetical protein
MSEKNPYPNDSPEWQLWENWRAQSLLINGYTADIARLTFQRADTIVKRGKYREALTKLGNDPGE